MTIEIRVPTLGESITEAVIAQWFKKEGEAVKADEPLVELETEKVTVEVPAPAAGVLSQISVKDGETVEVGALLGQISEGEGAPAARAEEAPKEEEKEEAREEAGEKAAPAEAAPAETAPAEAAEEAPPLSPAVKKLVAENRIDTSEVTGTGKGGRITKADILAFLEKGPPAAAPAAPAEARAPAPEEGPREERVRMTRLRQTIARRLKEAQNTAAMLTTFNEVDMTSVMALRKQYRELFETKHGVRLGFMGFFVKAAIAALRDVPAVNAEIDGEDLVYKNHYDIGVAVGTDKGLVVPVVRDADRMNLGEIEKEIADLARRAREGKLGIEEMQGGTFTITNGGIYGSLLSTPILNAPQSGILGMHKIQQRPMVLDGGIEARPMMYLALSYDHRIVDGKEAVTFLVRLKECVEDPQRLVLDL